MVEVGGRGGGSSRSRCHSPQDDSLYHSVVGAHGLLVTDAHGVLAATRPVLLFPQRFPAKAKRTFYTG